MQETIIDTIKCVLLLAIFAVFVGSWIATGWAHFRKVWEAHRCPKCQRSWAREDLREELVGVFQKALPKPPWRRAAVFGEIRVVPHGKYKLYHQCKYCGHEWTSTKTSRL
jgi:hypothetical protein